MSKLKIQHYSKKTNALLMLFVNKHDEDFFIFYSHVNKVAIIENKNNTKMKAKSYDYLYTQEPRKSRVLQTICILNSAITPRKAFLSKT